MEGIVIELQRTWRRAATMQFEDERIECYQQRKAIALCGVDDEELEQSVA